jgi:hypothetical protein
LKLIGVSDNLHPSLAFAGKAEAYNIEASDDLYPSLIFASKAGACHSKTSYEFHPIKILQARLEPIISTLVWYLQARLEPTRIKPLMSLILV